MKLLFSGSILVSIAVLATGCGGTYEPKDAKGLAECYKAEFGSLPPASVKNLHAKQIVVYDTVGAWLRFETTPAVIDSLLSANFVKTNRTSLDNFSGANTPKWWTPNKDKITEFYGVRGWRTNFYYSQAIIAFDKDKRIVYFGHTAFD